MLPADTFKINLFQSTPSARRATYIEETHSYYWIISIHALREEGDDFVHVHAVTVHQFQSTPSARRATDNVAKCYAWVGISIHALREEGDLYLILHKPFDFAISIHALREEGDLLITTLTILIKNFNPRPPRGGRLHPVVCPRFLIAISIHALREEGDCCSRSSRDSLKVISIHALREEGDAQSWNQMLSSTDFNPRPPRGGRREKCANRIVL